MPIEQDPACCTYIPVFTCFIIKNSASDRIISVVVVKHEFEIVDRVILPTIYI